MCSAPSSAVKTAVKLTEVRLCRDMDTEDERVTITALYGQQENKEGEPAGMTYNLSDNHIVLRNQWHEELKCYASWALAAAGNIELVEVKLYC